MAISLKSLQKPATPSLVESMQEAVNQPSLIYVPESYRKAQQVNTSKDATVTLMVTASASASKGASLSASHTEWRSNLLICTIVRVIGDTMFYTLDEDDRRVPWDKKEVIGASVTLIFDPEDKEPFEEQFRNFKGTGGGLGMSFKVECPAEFEAGGIDTLILRAYALKMWEFQAPVLERKSAEDQKRLAVASREINAQYAMERVNRSRIMREERMKQQQATSGGVEAPTSTTMGEESVTDDAPPKVEGKATGTRKRTPKASQVQPGDIM